MSTPPTRKSVATSLRTRRKTARPVAPIQAHPVLLTAVVAVGLFVLVAVCWAAAQAYRKSQSESSVWLLMALLAVVVVLLVPMFYGPHIGLSLDFKGLRLGRLFGARKTSQTADRKTD